MTAVTAPAPPARAQRPIPWTKLAWVTWRQHRVALAGVAVLLGGLAVYLLVMGLKIHSAYQAVLSCHPLTSAECLVVTRPFSNYHQTALDTGVLLLAIPALVGVFVGAPLLARELEAGTFRFAWTQGCGRLRWAAAKLSLLAITVTVAAGAFSLLFRWFYQPFLDARLDGVLAPQLFNLVGVDFAAWTLVAFSIGAIAGVLIRRTVPAMAASLAVWAGLALGTALFPCASTTRRPWSSRAATPQASITTLPGRSASGIPARTALWLASRRSAMCWRTHRNPCSTRRTRT